MSFASSIRGLGSVTVAGIIGEVADSISASGSTQATATQLGRAHSRITSVSAGGGVRLHTFAGPGDTQYVYNDSTTDLLVYPPVGQTINGFSANAAMTVPGKSQGSFKKQTIDTWICDEAFVQSGTGAQPRTAQGKEREVASAKDSIGETYGADDTTALQNRITDEASSTGREILVNAGTLITTGVTLPGTINQQVSLRGDPQTKIKAKAGATVLVKINSDITRTGFREIKSLKIDGDSVASVVGLRAGDTTATLQLYLRSLDIRSCDVGVDLITSMESSIVDVVCYQNTVGLKLRQDSIGGCNANRFDGLRVQSNTIGLILDASASLPMHNNQFNNALIQSNTLCGVAMFGVAQGIQFNACHFEANGSSGTTSSVDGNTVRKSVLQLNDSWAVFSECTFSETSTPCILLESGARVTLRNSAGYGLTSGTFVSGSLAETVEFYGHHNCAGTITAHVARWPDTIQIDSGAFMAIGTVILTPTPAVSNDYVASTPTVPTLANANGGAVINADAGDSEMGIVSNVTYAASAGSTSSNRITINALPTGVTSGDTWAVTFLVKASASTSMGFWITSGSFATFSGCPVDTKWRRVVMVSKAGSCSLPSLQCFPTNADAPTVYFAKIQSLRIASGGDLTKISEVVSLGLFNNNQNEFYYSAAPTVGTWKRGDRVWNTAPAAGGAPGWVCTTAGTPGTWKAMANLAA